VKVGRFDIVEGRSLPSRLKIRCIKAMEIDLVGRKVVGPSSMVKVTVRADDQTLTTTLADQTDFGEVRVQIADAQA